MWEEMMTKRWMGKAEGGWVEKRWRFARSVLGESSLSKRICAQQWNYNGHGTVQPGHLSCGTRHGAVSRWRICEHEETGGHKYASERGSADIWIDGFEDIDGHDGYVWWERQSRDFDGFVGHHHHV
jgi:hypothetical protein